MHIHAAWPSLSYNEVISYNVIVFRLHLRVNTHQQHSPSGQRVQLHIPTDMVCATCTCDLEIFWFFRVSVIIFLRFIGVSFTQVNIILWSRAVLCGQPTSPSLAFLRYFLVVVSFKNCFISKNYVLTWFMITENIHI